MSRIHFILKLFLLLFLIIGHNAVADIPSTIVPSLAPMLEKVTPTVVNISTRTRIRVQENPLFNDPFFRFFFDLPDQKPRERDSQSLGSGVVIDDRKGYVITNHHVVDKAQEITVTLRDGRVLNAKLVGFDPETDVALLQVPPEGLTAIPIANSDKLRVGDFVVAIGNPFGLGQTVTSGIVSALGRSGLGIEGYEDFIQTDASINPGNSGGALVDLRGELVGINTAILAPGGGNVGIGFAIPMNMASQVIQHLVEFGEVRRGFVGVQVQDLTPELASAFGLGENRGAVVADVVENSPAEKAGVQIGDIITAINRQPVHSASSVRNRVGLLRVDEAVEISVLRKGRSLTFNATIADSNNVDGKKISEYFEGMVLGDSHKGIKVVEVARRTPAWSIGFRPGDLIIGLNRRAIKEVAELKRLMNQLSLPLLIRVNREGEILSILLK